MFVNHNPTLYPVYRCSVLCLFSGHMCRRCTPVLPILAFPTRDPTHSSDATQLLAMPVLLHHSRSYNTTIRLSVFRHRSSLFPKSHTTRLVKKKCLNSNIHSATILLHYLTAEGVLLMLFDVQPIFLLLLERVFLPVRDGATLGGVEIACVRTILPTASPANLTPLCEEAHDKCRENKPWNTPAEI